MAEAPSLQPLKTSYRIDSIDLLRGLVMMRNIWPTVHWDFGNKEHWFV